MSQQLGPVDSRPNEEPDEEPLTNDSTFNERIEEEVRQMDLPAPVETTERPQTGEVEGNTTAPRRSEASSQPADTPSSGRNRDLEDLYARIADINSQVHRVSSSAPEIDRMFEETQRTPFTSRITQARIPHIKLRLPTYDGDKDPRTFMTAFMAAVTKAHFSDEEKDTGHCQLFVESLTGNALTWFSRLSPNSIDNFAQLSTSFLRHYRHFIQPGASSIDLWDTTQKVGETLQQYLVRFKNLLAKVSVPEDAALAAFRKGLVPGSSLRKDLAIRDPKDLDDALHRASRYTLFEEEYAKLAAKSGANRPTPQDRKRENYRESRKHYEGKDASRGEISAISEEASNQKTSSKEAYCTFHKFAGHSTEECKHLSNYLLDKYKSGEIEAVFQPKEYRGQRPDGRRGRGRGRGQGTRQYRDDGPDRRDRSDKRRSPDRRDRSDERRSPDRHNDEGGELPGPPKRQRGQRPQRAGSPARGRITMILGTPEDCNDSVRALKKRARQVCSLHVAPEDSVAAGELITFSSDDAKGIQHPHNDSIVVEVTMGNYDVERVLIDTGSTVNVLFLGTLAKMGISESEIKPKARTLTGYDGTTRLAMGDIKIEVKVGVVAKKLKLTVVDAPLIYNAILGSTWIYAMRAIHYVYHLCVKFPTPTGIYILYGDQKMSRNCCIIEKKQRRDDLA
ncbi:uncharacterized protein LOC111829555 [Capsella rubella]|uniref:uncharacterized protein LOC111829555 n=1 Tax=Capsella rubella TaxID=81985 RepID=UPI000CD59C5C|nr:uncharacterized protein LOC111829555 [Capsella rubella]